MRKLAVFLITAALCAAAAFPAAAGEADYKKTCEQAKEIVKENMSKENSLMSGFKLGPGYPTDTFISGAASYRSSGKRLLNIGSYGSLRSSEREFLQDYFIAYDTLVGDRRVQFNLLAVAPNGKQMQNDMKDLDLASRQWKSIMKDSSQALFLDYIKVMQAIATMQLDFQDMAQHQEERSAADLTSRNLMKGYFESHPNQWPPKRSDAKNIDIPGIYGIKWITKDGKITDKALGNLNKLDAFTEKLPRLKKAQLAMKNNIQPIIDYQTKIDADISKLQRLWSNKDRSQKDLDFGLYEEVGNAIDYEKSVSRQIGEQIKNYSAVCDNLERNFMWLTDVDQLLHAKHMNQKDVFGKYHMSVYEARYTFPPFLWDYYMSFCSH